MATKTSKAKAAKGKQAKAEPMMPTPTPEPAQTKRAKAGTVTATVAVPGKKLSALDAAAQVLAEAGTPLTCQAMIDAMATQGYWTSPGGKTPASTLYAAILRELKVKGNDARFAKTERGKFALRGAGR